MSFTTGKGLIKDKTKPTEPSIVNFILSHTEYTELWLKFKNNENNSRTFELMKKLMKDHSALLEGTIKQSVIKIVWSDGFGEDKDWNESYGEKKSKK
jgi:hypothetical protein